MKKNIIVIAFIILTCLGFTGCPETKEYQPPRPTPIVTDTEFCEPAQKHLEELCLEDRSKNSYCCEVVKPTLKNKSYTNFCIEKQNQGLWLNPKCTSQVKSCEQIDICTNSN